MLPTQPTIQYFCDALQFYYERETLRHRGVKIVRHKCAIFMHTSACNNVNRNNTVRKETESLQGRLSPLGICQPERKGRFRLVSHRPQDIASQKQKHHRLMESSTLITREHCDQQLCRVIKRKLCGPRGQDNEDEKRTSAWTGNAPVFIKPFSQRTYE